MHISWSREGVCPENIVCHFRDLIVSSQALCLLLEAMNAIYLSQIYSSSPAFCVNWRWWRYESVMLSFLLSQRTQSSFTYNFFVFLFSLAAPRRRSFSSHPSDKREWSWSCCGQSQALPKGYLCWSAGWRWGCLQHPLETCLCILLRAFL